MKPLKGKLMGAVSRTGIVLVGTFGRHVVFLVSVNAARGCLEEGTNALHSLGPLGALDGQENPLVR